MKKSEFFRLFIALSVFLMFANSHSICIVKIWSNYNNNNLSNVSVTVYKNNGEQKNISGDIRARGKLAGSWAKLKFTDIKKITVEYDSPINSSTSNAQIDSLMNIDGNLSKVAANIFRKYFPSDSNDIFYGNLVETISKKRVFTFDKDQIITKNDDDDFATELVVSIYPPGVLVENNVDDLVDVHYTGPLL